MTTRVERPKKLIGTALGISGPISDPSGAAAKPGIPRQKVESKIKALDTDLTLLSRTLGLAIPGRTLGKC